MRGQFRHHPFKVSAGHAESPLRIRKRPYFIAVGTGALAKVSPDVRPHGFEWVPIVWNASIEANDVRDPFGDSFCDGASHKTGQAMTDKNYVIQFFIFQNGDDILNVRAQINLGIMQMGTLANARECDRMDFMPGGA